MSRQVVRVVGGCQICGGDLRFLLAGGDINYATTDELFCVFRCVECGAEPIWPVPTVEEVNKFYPRSYYSLSAPAKSWAGRLREIAVMARFDPSQLRLIMRVLGSLLERYFLDGLPERRLSTGCTFLDVGCGSGSQVELMHRYGWVARGFEVNHIEEYACSPEWIISAPKLEASLFDTRFGFIRVWHVLEHVVNPGEFVCAIRDLLAPDGVVLFGLPNAGGLVARLFGRYWYNRDLPRHVVNYRVASVRHLLAGAGLRIVEVKYRSVGGVLGSIQNCLSRIGVSVSLLNRFPLVVVVGWLEWCLDRLRVGDLMVIKAQRI